MKTLCVLILHTWLFQSNNAISWNFLFNYYQHIDTSIEYYEDSYFPGGVTQIKPRNPADDVLVWNIVIVGVVVWMVVVVGVVVVWMVVVVGVVVWIVNDVVVCGVTFVVVVVLIVLVVECVFVLAGVVFEHLHLPKTHLVFLKEHLMAYL